MFLYETNCSRLNSSETNIQKIAFLQTKIYNFDSVNQLNVCGLRSDDGFIATLMMVGLSVSF